MSADLNEHLAELEKRIELLEKEVADKRSTDAFLYLMITSSADSLMGLLTKLRLTLTGKDDDRLEGEVRENSKKYMESSETARDLIWGADDETT